MQPIKKLYASFIDANWQTSIKTIEIKNEQDAAQHALKTGSICFSTYEIDSVIIDGKEFSAAPENFSARRYVGIDKIYTRDEVVVSTGMNIFNQDPVESVYITGLERPGEFIRLKEGEKLFGRNGQQVWPQQNPSKLCKTLKLKF